MKTSDEVFITTGSQTESLPARPFREGLSGKKLEDALQDLLARHPNLLPGRQMDPGSEDPPKFFLLRREMPVSGWALDHLFVDQYGVLTLVETKLLQNPESRRDVIGQVLEYAANAQDAWSDDKLRLTAEEYWKGKLDQNIQTCFEVDEVGLQKFWANLNQNLQAGRFRLVVVGDELRPEIRRILEYLNREMKNVDVFGLEIRCFGNDSRQVIVPYLVGAVASGKSSAIGSSRTWTPEMLREACGDFPDTTTGPFLRLLDWACDNRVFMESTTKDPCFGTRSSAGVRLCTFSLNWNYFSCGPDVYKGGVDERNSLFEELKSLGLYPKEMDLASLRWTKNTKLKLGDLSSSEIERLLAILAKHTKPSTIDDGLALAKDSATD